MQKKTAKRIPYALIVMGVCFASWFGYRVLSSRSHRPGELTKAQTAEAAVKPSEKAPPRWLSFTFTHIGEPQLSKWEAAVKRNKQDPDAHYYYADALEQAGFLDAAIDQYRMALKLPPKYSGRAYLYRDLGLALLKKGDIDGALDALGKSVVSWPVKHNLSCYVYEREALGQLLEIKGDYQGAIRYWDDLASVAKYPEKCREHSDRIRQFLNTGQ